LRCEAAWEQPGRSKPNARTALLILLVQRFPDTVRPQSMKISQHRPVDAQDGTLHRATDASIPVSHSAAVPRIGAVVANTMGRESNPSIQLIDVLWFLQIQVRKPYGHPRSLRVHTAIGGPCRRRPKHRGTDVFKALALGATAVGIGRPQAWGLAAGGQPGVEAILDIYNRELRHIMRQAGTPSIKEITRDRVVNVLPR
jgi:FMN-dependent dehydrogenase